MKKISAMPSFRHLILSGLLLVICGVVNADNSDVTQATWSFDFKRTWGPCKSGTKCIEQVQINHLCVTQINNKGTTQEITLETEKCRQIKNLAVEFVSLGNDICSDMAVIDLNEDLAINVNDSQIIKNLTMCKGEVVQKIKSFTAELLNRKPLF